jgi:hypothetical protein
MVSMIELAPIFKVLGVGVVTHFGGSILENMGQGSKVLYLKIAGYAVCAWIAFDVWWTYLQRIAAIFGVHV